MRALVVLLSMLALVGCEGEDKLADFYAHSCLESSRVPLNALGADSTCNGSPLLFAFRSAPDLKSSEMRDLFELANAHGFDFDRPEVGTGRTALMMAVRHPDPRWIDFFRRGARDPNLRDRAGRTYLHHLAERAEFKNSGAALAGADLDATDGSGRTAAELSYDLHHYDVTWALLAAGASFDFLLRTGGPVDPAFLIHDEINENLRVLDALPVALSATFAVGPGVVAASLVDLAGLRCLPNLAGYLAQRGAVGTRALACPSRTVRDSRVTLLDGLARGAPLDRPLLGVDDDRAWLNPNHRNRLNQNFAHLYAYDASSAEYDADWTVRRGGFRQFLDLAGRFEWLERADVLGLTPAFSWLASPRRAEERGFFARRTAQANWSDLLARVKDRRVRTVNGDTLLSFAVLTGQLRLVKATLEGAPELKAEIHTKNKQGLSPLDLAHDNSLWDIHEYLRKI